MQILQLWKQLACSGHSWKLLFMCTRNEKTQCFTQFELISGFHAHTTKVTFCMSAFGDNATPRVSIEYKEPFMIFINGEVVAVSLHKVIDCGYLVVLVPLPCTRVHRNVWHVVHPGLPAAKTTRQGLRRTIQITIRDTLH